MIREEAFMIPVVDANSIGPLDRWTAYMDSCAGLLGLAAGEYSITKRNEKSELIVYKNEKKNIEFDIACAMFNKYFRPK